MNTYTYTHTHTAKVSLPVKEKAMGPPKKVARPKVAARPTRMSAAFGEVKIMKGAKQSYLQRRRDDGWQLVVAVSNKQSADHHSVIEKLADFACLPPPLGAASKDDMLRYRAELLAAVA